jgi:hypothetical protein
MRQQFQITTWSIPYQLSEAAIIYLIDTVTVNLIKIHYKVAIKRENFFFAKKICLALKRYILPEFL